MSESGIFKHAIKLPAEQRAAYLSEACGANRELREEVESLLHAVGESSDFLDKPAVARIGATVDYAPIAEGPGTIIGPYKLLQQIGEGGFGVVYMAEQEKPVRRMVALKIIKPGMDTAQVIARFESERQALALMDHPHIAKVLDAGATASGRPFFVMELVKGVPVTEFCDKNHMAAEQRLKLFIDVCHAIQHAHHKGVIHRDIKPSNVMVTLHDGVPVVKVIDFGVAKATVQKLTERTLFTAYGQMIGTPAYMSPEQAEMSGLDIDTRSDIYSLGVLLYELLTGTTPLESKRLREAGYAEMQRLIREEEAPRPSTRLSSLGQSATVLAGNRGTDPKQLARLLAGDLDWIVMKALDKDRNRRYSSPGNFAEDIERYLHRDAILARPPSTAYKFKKFVQRNRAVMLTATGVAVALLLGTTVATWQAIAATRARQDAIAARNDEMTQRQSAEEAAAAERKAKQAAQTREAETKAVLEFVESRVFAAARPLGQDGGLGHDVTLRRAIEAALPFVGMSFAKQPLVEASLRMTLGVSFLYLGEASVAAEEHERARAILVQQVGPEHSATLECTNNLANCYQALNRNAEALKLREETLAAQRRVLGPDHPSTLISMMNLANSYADLDRQAKALKLREETLAAQRRVLGPDHRDTLVSMANLANSYAELNRHPEAITLLEETIAIRKRVFPSDHPVTLTTANNLARSYAELGRYSEAIKLLEETLTVQRRVLPIDHPNTLSTMLNLANCYTAVRRYAEALELEEKTLATRRRVLSKDDPDTLHSMNDLANVYAEVGRLAEALKLREETLATRKRVLPPDHPDTLTSMHNLAGIYADLNRHAEAIKLGEETLATRRRVLTPDHPNTLSTMSNLANSYAAVGRHAEAIKLCEETLAKRQRVLPPNHLKTLGSMNNLAWMLATVPDAKLRNPRRAVELATYVVATDSGDYNARGTLGTARYRAGDWIGAIADLEQVTHRRKADDPTNADEGFFLAMAHWQLGAKDKAKEWFAKSVAWMDRGKKDDPELKRFRAEAAELLGLQEWREKFPRVVGANE